MKQEMYFQITGVLFAIIALLHGVRIVYGWDAVIGDWMVPVWASFVGLVVAGYLSYSAFKLMK